MFLHSKSGSSSLDPRTKTVYLSTSTAEGSWPTATYVVAPRSFAFLCLLSPCHKGQLSMPGGSGSRIAFTVLLATTTIASASKILIVMTTTMIIKRRIRVMVRVMRMRTG